MSLHCCAHAHHGLVEDCEPPRCYDIGPNNDGRAFLPALAKLVDAFLVEAEQQVGTFIDRHLAFLANASVESSRSRGEYALELLTLGMLRREYAALANATPAETRRRLLALWRLRTDEPQHKSDADAERGHIFLVLLARARNLAGDCDDSRLLAWLTATGEFVQESAQLRPWVEGSDILWSRDELERATAALARWFEREAKAALGRWTQGVEAFRAEVLAARVPREDLLLVTRAEALYHLNMVGAEIMNRGFRPGFTARPRRVVLLPGCMRTRNDGTCQARRDGLDMSCTHCSPTCEVAAIDRLGEMHGFRVFVVPHASSFSAWLEHWSRDPHTALVVAACPPHLLAGGYEIRALGIAAQCLLLHSSGCRRHWDPVGTPTRIDKGRLLELLPAPARRPEGRA